MAKLHAVGYREDDVYLHCAPLFHVGGLSSMIAMLAVGATQVRRQLPHHLQLPVKVCAVRPEVLKLDDILQESSTVICPMCADGDAQKLE